MQKLLRIMKSTVTVGVAVSTLAGALCQSAQAKGHFEVACISEDKGRQSSWSYDLKNEHDSKTQHHSGSTVVGRMSLPAVAGGSQNYVGDEAQPGGAFINGTFSFSATIHVVLTWVREPQNSESAPANPLNPNDDPPQKVWVRITSSAFSSAAGGEWDPPIEMKGHINSGYDSQDFPLAPHNIGLGSRVLRKIEVSGDRTVIPSVTLSGDYEIPRYDHRANFGAGINYIVDVIPLDYALSTNPGSGAGSYPGTVNWDDTLIAPDAKDFFAVVKASVPLPVGATPDPTIEAEAHRIKYVNNVATLTGETEAIPTLHLITASDDEEGDKPRLDPFTGNKIWTYRTHVESDREAMRRRGELDWKVTKLKGRWMLRVKPQHGSSSTSEFKVDKRSQIATYAGDWADYWPTLGYQHDTIGYPECLPPVPPGGCGSSLFSGCDGFVNHVYSRHGLSAPSSALSAGFPADSGLGAFRDFRLRSTPFNSSSFDHVGLITGEGTFWDQMVDVNNANDPTGPTRRSATWGTGVFGQYWGGTNPENRSFPDPNGSTHPNGIPKTELQALDDE